MIHADFKPNQGSNYLTDLSPRDAKWKELKPQNLMIANDYAGTVYDKYYTKMNDCSGFLRFALVPDANGETVHKLKDAHFCRIRVCPICQWRRSLIWRARTIRAMSRILLDYPGKRFIYLTLTWKNCELDNLSDSIAHASSAWQRLIKRPQFKAIGWLRNLEVTRSPIGEAHPHFHALLMVAPGYFAQDYLNQKDWIALWRSCLRVEYDPSVRVNVVKPKKITTTDTSDTAPLIDEGLLKAIRYTLKYSTKPEDLKIADTSDTQQMQDWLVGLTTQMHNKRSVATGGIFKKYLAEDSDIMSLIVDDSTADTSEKSESDLWAYYQYGGIESDYLLEYVL